MYEEIAKQIANAALNREKSAMFHLQVLKNARHLRGVNPVEFCRLVGVEDSYKVEFSKMIKLAELMERQGIKLTEPRG